MTKEERQGILLRVLSENQLSTQADLLTKLAEKGVHATQATISRDIQELNIQKKKTSGHPKPVYTVPGMVAIPSALTPLADTVQETVERISTVEFMVIIQTVLGSANRLAAKIDDLTLPMIAGTLAGANTLAIITTSRAEATELAQTLSNYLSE